MLKVLIVDDELLARLALRTAIAWEEHGFEVVAEAEDGITGFQYVEQFQPDIVLTDISMPGMNGVELIKKIKAFRPDTEVIILSCHNDFEYVKEGLRSGAADYILKLSMSMEELLEELLQLKEKILKKSIVPDSPSKELERKKWPDILFSLITSETSDANALDEGRTCGLLENGAYAILGILIVDPQEGNVPDYKQRNMIEHLAQAVMARYKVGIYIPFEQNRGVVLCQMNHTTEGNEKICCMKSMMEELIGLIHDYHGVNASAGISSVGELSFLKACYCQAYEAISQKFYTGPGIVHLYKKKSQESPEAALNKEWKGAPKTIDAFDLETVKNKTQIWLNEISVSRYPEMNVVKKNIHELLFRIKADVMMAGDGKTDISLVEKAYHQIQKQNYLLEMNDTLMQFFSEAENSERHNKDTHREIIEAKKYVSQYYSSHIKLFDVAKHVNMNVDYFSHLFKKETGHSFTEYLNEFRIEKAKPLLLSGQFKVYETAFAVGFQDENYFIKRFKKQTGYTPSEYMRL